MLPFTIRQIEAFLTLCNTGSFRIAAEEMGISQPAISRLLKSLENQLGFNLFTRSPGHSAQLSLNGEEFRDRATIFIKFGIELASARKEYQDNRLINVKTFIGGHLMDKYIRNYLAKFHQNNPNIVLDFIQEKKRKYIYDDIINGRIDFSLFSKVGNPNFYAEKIGFDNSAIVANKIFIRDKYTCEEISNLPFVLPPEGTWEEDLILDALSHGNIFPKNIYGRASYSEGRLALTASGGCVTYSTSSARAAHPHFQLAEIFPMPRWDRWLYLKPSMDKDTACSIRTMVLEALIGGSV